MLLSISLFIKGVFFVALAFFIVGAFLVLIIPIARSLRAQLSTSPTINIESAMIGNEDVATYLALRANELGRGVHLDALYEVRVPLGSINFGSGDKFKLPDDLKIDIQGVNVTNVVTNVLKILPEDRYTIKVEGIKGATDAVRVEWKPPGGKSQAWLLRPEKFDTKDSSSKRMADRVIATILHYMYYDRDGPTEWRKDRNVATASNEPVFPNARALEAYFVGQQYLNAHLLNNEDPAPLENAELEFRRLQKEMPDFADGLMLLGVTLSERRDEANAIVAYGRAKDVIAARIERLTAEIDEREKKASAIFDYDERTAEKKKIDVVKSTRIAAQKMFFQAQLFQANAYRKLYVWRDLVSSIRELDDLEKGLVALNNTPLPGTSKQDELDFKIIGAAALAEKANSLGYGLILLYPETYVDALKDMTSPRTLEVPQARRARLALLSVELAKTPVSQVAIDQRNSDFLTEMTHLADKQKEVLEKARDAIVDIAKLMGSSTAVQSAWEKEKNRLESLLLSAEGYGIFRRAQLVEPDTKAGNENFIARSEDALGKLHQADAKQPGQYVVLQNLGIVYGDPRYDIRNQKIAVARRYFERSTEIKPNDYFGLQSLAVLAVRQGYAWGVDYAEEPFKSAVGKASESLKARPGNGTVFVTQAQLATLFWSADVEANKKKWEASFNTALANAHGVRANPIRILVARLQWGLLQLRAATADPPPPQNPQPGATTPQPQKGTFSVEKAAFKNLLDEAKTEASKIPGWEAEQLGRVIKSFLDRIDPLPFEKRDTLVWPASPLKPD